MEEHNLVELEQVDLEVEVEDDSFAVEKGVGISEFVNADSLGFSGILKHRFSDFKVSEVGLDGKVVTLTEHLFSPELLSLKTEATASQNKDSVTMEMLKETFGVHITDEKILSELLEPTEVLKGEGILTEEITSKEARTCIHQGIRNMFKGRLQTQAEGNCIRIYSRQPTTAGTKRSRDDRNTQPPDQRPYLAFTLRKENVDTIEAVQVISRRLHMNSKDFSYAGTKDRRGVTEQRIVGRNITPNKILGINKLFEDGRLKVSNIEVAQKPLSLGDLLANRFSLVIRDISAPGDVEEDIRRFKENGFINYFGLQRFGTGVVTSHAIGTELLKGNFEAAVGLILDPREGENDQRAVEARRLWKDTGDAEAVHSMFPSRYTAERQILAHFMRHINNSNDFMGAILSINRELRLMYVHSVQSLIWNRAASTRYREMGNQIQIGDLVLRGEETKDAVLVTSDNIGEFNILDLALPMPGHSTICPSNSIKTLYEEELNALGIDLTTAFRPKNKSLWDLPGAYRRVFVKPADVSYQIGNYSDPIVDLPAGFEQDGAHRGLYIEFTLGTSCYATMAIRELMHQTTDSKTHKAFTKNHK